MHQSIQALINDKQSQQFELYDQYLNHQLLNVLKTLGFDKNMSEPKVNTCLMKTVIVI